MCALTTAKKSWKTVQEKDNVINHLFDKVKVLEEKIFVEDESIVEESEMNNTFFNPSVGFQCEQCDFIA